MSSKPAPFFTVFEVQDRRYIKFVEPSISLEIQAFSKSGNDPAEVTQEFKKYARFQRAKRIDDEKSFQQEVALFQRDLDRLKSWNSTTK